MAQDQTHQHYTNSQSSFACAMATGDKGEGGKTAKITDMDTSVPLDFTEGTFERLNTSTPSSTILGKFPNDPRGNFLAPITPGSACKDMWDGAIFRFKKF